MGFTGKLRTQEGRKEFMQEVARIEEFLNDPWLIKSREDVAVQVLVPKVVVNSAPPPLPPILLSLPEGTGGGGEGVTAKPAALSQIKRVVLQKQAAATSVVTEDFVKKFESGDLVTSVRGTDGDEQGLSNTKVMCRICFTGENEGSERVRKMLPCCACGKKYHRNCLKRWSQNRDLFHWSSWACPSCRICEVCHKTGDPSKFMFCKRCDSATHCYCQQPPHKNVGHGPYLCPKHTRCHSCASSVPGNGLSVRWFLGYTCCDACGRLFVKGNYCPVCLKVYRDSEATPMVCCDICQRWVHCPCDQISDAKYMEFQSDGNLQYVCPTCRGECCQIRNLEESVQELWRRRDETEKDLIASLRAAAGLPTQEEIFDISPFSDDEDSGSTPKADVGRSLKLSLKGLSEKSPRKSKDHAKKSLSKTNAKKKGSETSLIGGNGSAQIFVGQSDGPFGYITGNSGEPAALSPPTGSLTDGMGATVSTYKNIDEVAAKTSRTIKIKSNKSTMEDAGPKSDTAKMTQGRKLVIHLGGRNRNTNSPTTSEPSNIKKGEDLTSSSGNQKEHADQVKGSNSRRQEGPVIKLKNANKEASNASSKLAGDLTDGSVPAPHSKTYSVLGTRAIEGGISARVGSEVPLSKRYRTSLKFTEDVPVIGDVVSESNSLPSVIIQASTKERKPSLKFKIPKNANDGKQNITGNLNSGTKELLSLSGKDELIYTRGQRSKRKRPAVADEDSSQRVEDSTMNDFADANWVLQKLGKDAAGKRVEVHHPSNDSWRRGTVVKVVEDLSTVSVSLDDGKTKSFELGKQGIRFVSQKHKP